MIDRVYRPEDPDVIRTARATGRTPEYVADAMNSPLAADVDHSIAASTDKAAIIAACEGVLDGALPGFTDALMEAMLEGYRLGYAHGVRATAVTLAGPMRRDVTRPESAAEEVTARADGQRSDVRPHVPHVDPDADDRLHLIVHEYRDGIGADETACGIRRLTSKPIKGTRDVSEYDCRDCTAALQRAADEAGLPTDDQISDLLRRAVAVDNPEAEACAGAASGILVDTVVGRSLGGELIDMTQAVSDYATLHKLRRWQCRHCGRGRVMGPYAAVTAREEGAEAVDHEAHCDRNPNRPPGSLVEDIHAHNLTPEERSRD